MNSLTIDILALHDMGQHAEQIANALKAMKVTRGRVYAVLREHRPDRERKPRRRVSGLPAKIHGYKARGIAQSRIAVLLGTSRQYVHKVLNESG